MILTKLLTESEYNQVVDASEFVAPPQTRMSTTSLWTAAVLLWGVGDLATTYYGIEQAGAIEKNPIAKFVLDEYGWGGLVAQKAFGLALVYGLTQGESEEIRRALLTVMAVFGIAATTANSTSLAFPSLR